MNLLPPAWRGHRVALLLAAAALLVIALLLPDFRTTRAVAQVVVVLDVTQSMNTLDCRLDRAGAATSRLACVKVALAEALRAMPCGAQVAWGAFTGNQTYVLAAPVEVCGNRGDLLDSLAQLDWRISWDAGSQIGSALISALRVVPAVPHDGESPPGLVFITDGQEAPALALRHRRNFEDYAGKVMGVVVGVGGDTLQPIPKYDMDGKYLGEWAADEVPQMDMRGHRALSSVPDEKMVGEDDDVPTGTEHLSSLKEPYLQLIAGEAKLDYRRLARSADMVAVLQSPLLQRPLPIDTDLRWIPAVVALVLLVVA
ncbi:MAG TPA: VWA domain-containing protein [Burkholderiaceae bacterium]|nr:VWA domain-containing protein [Burkholderiaceae bacterium]